jgi:hypothetical protein
MTDEKKETKLDLEEEKRKLEGLGKMPEPSVYEKLKMEFRTDSQKIESRIAQLERSIPMLTEEKQQLIGMLSVMQNVLQKDEEGKDGDDESKGNGNK